ncbi:MAG TPA: peptide methionine sulfoxide reductase, partial [Prevotella sp.]|nr:peptide methionine sulfoxide reductase [Prevotella sp.]
GEDKGTRYRTGIYYTDEKDLHIIRDVFNEEQKRVNDDIKVEILPLKNFYKAEKYHQDYLEKNPTGYCHLPQALFDFARQAKMKK